MTKPRNAISDIDPAPDSQNPRHPTPQKQSDGAPEPLNKPDPDDEHIGATEDQVSDTSAPAGSGFKDEPKQG